MKTAIILFLTILLSGATFVTQQVMAYDCGDTHTNTTGPVTDYFNNRFGCEVKVYFESPNTVQLQAQDLYDSYALVQGFELAYHWYEISKTDDGSYTTVVLAPLR